MTTRVFTISIIASFKARLILFSALAGPFTRLVYVPIVSSYYGPARECQEYLLKGM
jgi:hypothetical protein